MLYNKKGQMEPKEFVLILIIVAAFTIVSLLIFAKVSNTAENVFDPDTATTINESVTISMINVSSNSTLLAVDGFVENSETVKNATGGSNLVRGTDYRITLDGASGGLTTTANFTVITRQHNNTELKVTYGTNEESAAQTSADVIQTTVLDSFELGVISLIVLAAVLILGVLFQLGSQ